MYDECKASYFPSCEKGLAKSDYSCKGNAPFNSLEMAYFNISQRCQNDLTMMENLKMV